MRTQQWFTVVVMLAMVVPVSGQRRKIQGKEPLFKKRNALGAIANGTGVHEMIMVICITARG